MIGVGKDTRRTGGEVVEEAVGAPSEASALAETCEISQVAQRLTPGEAIVRGVVLEAGEERESRRDRVAEGLEVSGGVSRASGAYVKEVEARLDALVPDPISILAEGIIR